QTAEALHPRRRVAVERERPLVRVVLLRSLPVHAMPVQLRGAVEAVALIGPPAVDAVLHHGSVIGPVARHLAIGRPLAIGRAPARQRRRGAWIVDAAGEMLAFDHDVNHDLEVLVVERSELLARLGEVAGMPAELAVARVPAGGRELRAEIDERVAGKPLVAHRACYVGYLLGVRERAMRLQIAERP